MAFRRVFVLAPTPVILTYTLTENEYCDAQQAFRAHLSPARVLFRMMLPIAFGGALAGAYALFIVGNLAWGVGLCLASGYLVMSRTFGWRRRVRRTIDKHPEQLGPHVVEVTQGGITITPGTAEVSWPAVLRYFETGDLFLLLGPTRELCILPKRALPAGDMQQWTARLRAELKGKGQRDNPDALLLKATATWAVVALFVLALFAGSIQNLLSPVLSGAMLRTRTSTRTVSNPPAATAAAVSELNGSGAVYLVPLGKPQSVLSSDLLSFYRKKYGLDLHLLAPVPLPAWALDKTCHQLIAEELVEAMKRAYPQLANDPDAILIGVTDEDMYIADIDWSYAFSWRQEERFAVVSAARLNPEFDEEPANPKLVEMRTRKMITKDIGLLYYRLQPTNNYSSALYDYIDEVDDLDGMGEDFLTTDTEVRAERRLENGDPCFTIRHYLDAGRTRSDSGMLMGCSGNTKQLDMEVMEVDLRYGLFLDRRTEFYIPDKIPLQFTRVLRTQDGRSRAFGIGGTHSLNIFPVGNRWPFTWMDLIMADGGRVHYKRSNWGFGYWDATYTTNSGSGAFSGSKVSWNWPGWKLVEWNKTYYFPDGGGRRPEESALLAIEDHQGNRLNLPRDEFGNLIRAHSPNGSELAFNYDAQNRIMRVGDRNGAHVDYSYDAVGRLVHVESAGAQVTDYSYDAKNRMTTVRQNEKLILANEYDEGDRVIRQILPDGRVYNFIYLMDHSGRVVEVDVRDSAGITWEISMSGEAQYTLKPVRGH